MPKAFILVGVPGSGKSTWCNAYLNDIGAARLNVRVLSTDDKIDAIARERNSTYSAVFGDVDFKALEREMFAEFASALDSKMDIIVDRTNMSTKSRRRFVDALPADYERIAVVFEVGTNELRERLDTRSATTGKTIPWFVVENMLKNYEAPSENDFDEIIYVGRVTETAT